MTNILTISPQKRYLKGAVTFSVMTFSIMTLGIMDSITTLSINNTEHNDIRWVLRFSNCYAECCYTDCRNAECHGEFNHQEGHTYEKESLFPVIFLWTFVNTSLEKIAEEKIIKRGFSKIKITDLSLFCSNWILGMKPGVSVIKTFYFRNLLIFLIS
jgi:hypothetical protein